MNRINIKLSVENNLTIVKDKFRELPNNIEAEQSVIGSILVSNEIFDEINIIINSNRVTTSLLLLGLWFICEASVNMFFDKLIVYCCLYASWLDA